MLIKEQNIEIQKTSALINAMIIAAIYPVSKKTEPLQKLIGEITGELSKFIHYDETSISRHQEEKAEELKRLIKAVNTMHKIKPISAKNIQVKEK